MNLIRLFIPAILIITLAYGCAKSQKQDNVSQPESQNSVKLESDTTLYPSESDTIHINFKDGSAHLKIHKKERQGINLKFNSQDYTKMTARLSSKDSTANVRFAQIAMPNGDMDGPFSTIISYDLSIKGDYLLFIHENQMAGDPWSGDFDVNISLDK